MMTTVDEPGTESGVPADVKTAKLHVVTEAPPQIDIDLTNDADAIEQITAAIQAGSFKRLVRKNNELWLLGGDPQEGPITYEECKPSHLANLLSKSPFYCFKRATDKSGSSIRLRESPKDQVCRTVLANREWSRNIPKLQPNPGRWVLRCPNGTVEYLTGVLRDSTLADQHTREAHVRYDPNAGTDCPKFIALIKQVAPIKCCREALLDSLAYCITGATTQQKFFWLQGISNAGKSTVFKVICRLLGSYGEPVCPPELLYGSGKEHPVWMLELDGKRLVLQDELERGKRIRADVIKRVTSSNDLKGRGMGQAFRDLRISFKLVVSSNHKPDKLGDSGDGIYRRMMLWFVKEPYTGPTIDAYENVVVDAEGPQILNLLIARLARIRKEHIQSCDHIRGEVAWYENSNDPTNDFFREATVNDPKAVVCSDDLREAWTKITGEVLSPRSKKLGTIMHERGYEPIPLVRAWSKGGGRSETKRGYRGLRIREGILKEEPWVFKQ